MLEEIMSFNREFVESGRYGQFTTTKFPDKKLAILSCMDTRLTELLPAALGLKNGDAKIIKNAGAVVNHPYGSVMRSLMVCIYELGVETILVIGHEDCGMQNFLPAAMISKMQVRGVSPAILDGIRSAIDLERWLAGFGCVENAVRQTTAAIRCHPLIPADIEIAGLVIDPQTGRLVIIDATRESY